MDGVTAGAEALDEAGGALIGTHGCTAAFCPDNTGGPAGRIIPAGQGSSSGAGVTFAGNGGGFTAPVSSVFCFEPGHA